MIFRSKAILAWTSGVIALSVLSVGAWKAMNSNLFKVQVIEYQQVVDQKTGQEREERQLKLESTELNSLVGIELGQTPLVQLNLEEIEKRLLSHPWIKKVALQKVFPHSLSVRLTYRNPQAMLLSESGELLYIDEDGNSFGEVNTKESFDLPVVEYQKISREMGEQPPILDALILIQAWNESELAETAQLSTLSWRLDRGYRALVTYPLANTSAKGRTWIDLGQDLDAEVQFKRIAEVMKYLSSHRVLAQQIWADIGKKIVVKTLKGS